VTSWKSLQQPDREIYRAVVLGADGRELLVVAHDHGPSSFPWVDIPRDQRLCRKSYDGNEDGVELRNDLSIHPRPSILGRPHERSFAIRSWSAAIKHMIFEPVGVGCRRCCRAIFAKVADYAAVVQSVVECLAHVGGEAPGPFARIGWLTQLREWVEEVVTPLGLHLSRRFCQLNAAPRFSLIRLETNGPAIWFKAVGEPNLREFPSYAHAGRTFPEVPSADFGFALRVWNGWLAQEVEGTNLAETAD